MPVPLFLRARAANHATPVARRPYLVSYVGSLRHAPRALRARMRDVVRREARARVRAERGAKRM